MASRKTTPLRKGTGNPSAERLANINNIGKKPKVDRTAAIKREEAKAEAAKVAAAKAKRDKTKARLAREDAYYSKIAKAIVSTRKK
tara:strand:+ start:2667 stop:2924 length:258 start_codon:yes stop_codon:yes gene_type:complete